MTDPINHPPHYTAHPSGVKCIDITQHMNFCLGNALKYIWRCDEKGNAVQDLEKARWYISKEIERRGGKKEARMAYVDKAGNVLAEPEGLKLIPMVTGYGRLEGAVYSFGAYDEGRCIDLNELKKIINEGEYAAR